MLNTQREMPGTRLCTIETLPNRAAGFAISGMDPPPFKICKIERESAAEKAGLRLNDTLISINGQSVVATSYEDTISIIKEQLQQERVQVVVKQQSPLTSLQAAADSQSSISGTSSFSFGNIGGSEDGGSHRGVTAVQQYQSM